MMSFSSMFKSLQIMLVSYHRFLIVGISKTSVFRNAGNRTG